MAHHLSLEGGLAGYTLVDRSLMRGRGELIEDCYIPCVGGRLGCVHTKINVSTKCCLSYVIVI